MDGEHSFLCTRCGKTFPEPGDCPDHPDEPLLDTDDREVCFFLMRADDQAGNKWYGLWITVGLVAGAVLGILLSMLLNRIGDFDFSGTKFMILGGVAGGSAGTALARITFKPKYRRFTEKLEKI